MNKFKMKAYTRYDGKVEGVLVYTPELTEFLKGVTNRANQLRDLSAHDEGTCVLGAGIAIQVFYPRKRIPSQLILIHAPFQGNVGSFKALKPVLEYIKKEFPQLNARWEDGNMD